MRELRRRTPSSRVLKPIPIRARWSGGHPDPLPGEYLMTERGRLAYLITEVEAMPPASPYRFRLRCWRVARSEVPPGSLVHDWMWDLRTPRRFS